MRSNVGAHGTRSTLAAAQRALVLNLIDCAHDDRKYPSGVTVYEIMENPQMCQWGVVG